MVPKIQDASFALRVVSLNKALHNENSFENFVSLSKAWLAQRA
jgi:hypothetical protein